MSLKSLIIGFSVFFIVMIFVLVAVPTYRKRMSVTNIESGQNKQEMIEVCKEKECFRKLVILDHLCFYDSNYNEQCKPVDTYFSVQDLEE